MTDRTFGPKVPTLTDLFPGEATDQWPLITPRPIDALVAPSVRQSDDFDGSAELAMAQAFDGVLRLMFGNGPIPVIHIAGGCATLLVSYLSQLPPEVRTLILSEMVDVILLGFNDNPVTDLLN